VIVPQIGGGVTHATGTHLAVQRDISSAWRLAGKDLHLTVTVPVNTPARSSVPTST
jgi:hypothetical protein